LFIRLFFLQQLNIKIPYFLNDFMVVLYMIEYENTIGLLLFSAFFQKRNNPMDILAIVIVFAFP